MKRLILSFILLASISTPCAFGADSSFTAFWTKFKAAVAKRDKVAVAAMTKLPYLLDSKNLNKQQFIAKYDLLFPKGTATCFGKQKPVKDRESYFVFCGEQIYIFNQEKGQWLFAEIGVND